MPLNIRNCQHADNTTERLGSPLGAAHALSVKAMLSGLWHEGLRLPRATSHTAMMIVRRRMAVRLLGPETTCSDPSPQRGTLMLSKEGLRLQHLREGKAVSILAMGGSAPCRTVSGLGRHF